MTICQSGEARFVANSSDKVVKLVGHESRRFVPDWTICSADRTGAAGKVTDSDTGAEVVVALRLSVATAVNT